MRSGSQLTHSNTSRNEITHKTSRLESNRTENLNLYKVFMNLDSEKEISTKRSSKLLPLHNEFLFI